MTTPGAVLECLHPAPWCRSRHIPTQRLLALGSEGQLAQVNVVLIADVQSDLADPEEARPFRLPLQVYRTTGQAAKPNELRCCLPYAILGALNCLKCLPHQITDLVQSVVYCVQAPDHLFVHLIPPG